MYTSPVVVLVQVAACFAVFQGYAVPCWLSPAINLILSYLPFFWGWNVFDDAVVVHISKEVEDELIETRQASNFFVFLLERWGRCTDSREDI